MPAHPEQDDSSAWPSDAVEVGVVLGAWGVQGGLRIKPHSGDPQALLGASVWHWQLPETAPGPIRELLRGVDQPWKVRTARLQGEHLVAVVEGVQDRDLAQACRGVRLFVERSRFPATGPAEYYWVDLIGLAVLNRQHHALGFVVGLLQTGPHAVLRIQGQEGKGQQPRERLVPFVPAYVDEVDLPGGRIVVDWGLED